MNLLPQLDFLSVFLTLLSLPESMCIYRLPLESILSTVRADHIVNALVTNTSGSPVTIKQGILLGTYEVLDLPPLEELPPLFLAGIHALPLDTDLTDVVTQLTPHVKGGDYNEGRPALLKLLAQHRQAVALLGEPLGLTNRITHHIT